MKTSFLIIISFCGFFTLNGQIYISGKTDYSLKKKIIETNNITVKEGTPVYTNKNLSELVIYEFPTDSVISYKSLLNSCFEIDAGFIALTSYIPNTFSSPVLDSAVIEKLIVFDLISKTGIPANTTIELIGLLELTIDTTFSTISKIPLTQYGNKFTVKEQIGSYYIIEMKKLSDKDLYVKKDFLNEEVKSQLEIKTKDLIPLTISKLNKGDTNFSSHRINSWSLSSTFKSGDYSSRTYRSGSSYKTVTTFNGETETSYYTQY